MPIIPRWERAWYEVWADDFGTAPVTLVATPEWELVASPLRNGLTLTHRPTGDWWQLDEFYDEGTHRFKVRVRSLFFVGHGLWRQLDAARLFDGLDLGNTYHVYTARLVLALEGRDLLWRWDLPVERRKVAHHGNERRWDDRIENLRAMLQHHHEQHHRRPWPERVTPPSKALRVGAWSPTASKDAITAKWAAKGPYQHKANRLWCVRGGVWAIYHGNHHGLRDAWGHVVAHGLAAVVPYVVVPTSTAILTVYTGGVGICGDTASRTVTTREPAEGGGIKTTTERYREGRLVSRRTTIRPKANAAAVTIRTVTRRQLFVTAAGMVGARARTEVYHDGERVSVRTELRPSARGPRRPAAAIAV